MYCGVAKGVSGLLLVTGVWPGVILPAELRAGQRAAAVIDKGPGETFVVACPAEPLLVEQTAAEELARYVAIATGLKSRVVPENELDAQGGADAYVGATAYARRVGVSRDAIERESYVIRTHGGKLVIVGDDAPGDPYRRNVRTGTLFGVYDLLEEDLGVTWIWPGATGEFVPRRQGLRLPALDRYETPDFIIRNMSFGAYMRYEPQPIREQVRVWCKRMKLSWVPKAWFGHSWSTHVFKKELHKQHPEWLALWSGERRGPHLCTSNSKLRDHLVEAVLENADKKGYRIVSISPSDGVGFCECPTCRALDPSGTDYAASPVNLSNRHWDYANAIARDVKMRRPDLGLGMFAYTTYRDPPTNQDTLEDNIHVSFTFSAAYFVKPELKQQIFHQIDRWKGKGVKLVGREYWGMHYWLDLPYLFTQQIAESMPQLHQAGMIAMYGESGKNFATQGPNYWLVSHLMWDAEADAAATMDRFYAAFGPAERHVRDYYATLESCVRDHADKIPSFGYRPLINVWREVFPEAELRQAGAHLEQARRAAAGNKELEQRLRVVEVGYEYTVMMVELLETYRRLGRAGVPLWFFGPEGDLAQARHYDLPGGQMPISAQQYWQEHPSVRLPAEERLRLLKRAKDLGQQRERILDEYADLPAISRGLYQSNIERGRRPWHQTVLKEVERLE